jgi:Holliday junction resolvasome RuvABC DNA-binding subunit
LRDDLLSALVNLGYQGGAAEKSIDQVIKAAPDAGFEQALRDVLRSMMKGHDR